MKGKFDIIIIVRLLCWYINFIGYFLNLYYAFEETLEKMEHVR